MTFHRVIPVEKTGWPLECEDWLLVIHTIIIAKTFEIGKTTALEITYEI